MRTASFLALALAIGLALVHSRSAVAQPKADLKPIDVYKQFRDTVNEGKLDIAGAYLDQFLKIPPTEKDYIAILDRYGSTEFRKLLAVPRYSDDEKENKRIRANIEKLNEEADKIAAKLRNDEKRIARLVRNLGGEYEEKRFAQIELAKVGDVAVPYMVTELRNVGTNEKLAEGILDTIPLLNPQAIAVWVAALDALPPERLPGVIGAIAGHPKVPELIGAAQTDFTPYLWRYLARDPKGTDPKLRQGVLGLLNSLRPGLRADARLPEAELTAAARKFYDHSAKFIDVKTEANGKPPTTRLWQWEPAKLTLVPQDNVPLRRAEGYYGVMYAQWALEAKPDHEPAQSLILSLAAERAVEASKGGSLAANAPDVYKLLAAAPSTALVDMLARGISEKRTPLVLAAAQVLGDRGDRAAATALPGKPSPLVRALTYPDPAVQFAAASALLRSPVAVPAAVKPQIVDILRRAAGTADSTSALPGQYRGTVLMVDPVKYRSDANAQLLRSLNFDGEGDPAELKGLSFAVEQLGSGRELMRRIARASDFDLIFIDRHTADPELIDLIGHVESNPQTAARPVYVVASTDKPRMPTFDQLLVRMAAVIAATEDDVTPVTLEFFFNPPQDAKTDEFRMLPPPYTISNLVKPDDRAATRAKELPVVQERRDKVFQYAVSPPEGAGEVGRLARLRRIVESLPLELSADQRRLLDLRLRQITYAVLAAEYPITPASAPKTVAAIERTAKEIAAQPPSPPYGVGTASKDFIKLIEQAEANLPKERVAKFERLLSRVDAVELGLRVETYRDPAVEAKLMRTLNGYPAVRIIPEPYSRVELKNELLARFADPMLIPRDGAAKKADARAAVEFLRQMAIGDLPGYDLKTTESALIAALQVPDLAPSAIDAVERFKTGAARVALLNLALAGETVPDAVRIKAADAAIRHIGTSMTAPGAPVVASLVNQSKTEKNLELRGKLLAIRRLVEPQTNDLADDLKRYNPPLRDPEPKKEADPKKEPEPKKEP